MHAGSQRKVTTSHTRVQILCESVGLRCDHKHSIILRMYGAHKCVTRCFCGRNKVSKGTPCVVDVIGNCRCPCAKNKQPCTSSCRCKSCSNTYGIRCAQPTIRQRESYSSQKQPLAGRKGWQLLKLADESESIGQTTSLERLLLGVIVVHLMAKGICHTSENICKA